MVNILIKPDRDRDEYVYWSTEVEAPIGHGNRRGMLAKMATEWAERNPGQPYPEEHTPEKRAARADMFGSSAAGGYQFGHWDDDEMIFEQRGYLPREHLWEAAALLAHGLVEELWGLMVPFEDEAEVRRG